MHLARPVRRNAALILAFALASCGGEAKPPPPAPKVRPRATAMLGSVDLNRSVRASGTRPFWAMEIAPGSITITEFGGSGKVTDLYPVHPDLAEDRATYTTQTPDGQAVRVTLVRADCTEGGRPVIHQPLSAEVSIGHRTLKGCARAGTDEPIPATPKAAQPAR